MTTDIKKPPQEFLYEGLVFYNTLTCTAMLNEVREMEFTPDDVIVLSYPRSGSLWTKLLAYLTLHEGQQDALGEGLANVVRLEQIGKDQDVKAAVRVRKDTPSPKFFTSHMPFSFLRKQVLDQKVKVIVMMRNIKDMLVSYYHHYLLNVVHSSFTGDFDDFFDLLKQRRLFAGDPFEYNRDWWKVRHLPNVHVMKYEETKQDLPGAVCNLANFLDKTLSEEVIYDIAEAASFSHVKDNPEIIKSIGLGADPHKKPLISQTSYMRKGKVGDWKNYFTKDHLEYVAERCQEVFEPVGLYFMDTS